MVGMRVDTLIFVDVDGVLNVGVRDGDGGQWLLNENCVKIAMAYEDSAVDPDFRVGVPKMRSAAARYRDAICAGATDTSKLFIRRLAEVLRAAGPRRFVVLSSSWRFPRYAEKVERLEEDISKALGENFQFDALTDLITEAGPAERLQNIGNFVRRYCDEERPHALRIMVLDDFFGRALDGWSCGAERMRSTRDVEAHLRSCARGCIHVASKMLHCYWEWRTEEGHPVQAGVGLSAQGVEEATAFFGSTRRTSLRRFRGRGKLDATYGRQVAASLAVCFSGLMSMSFPIMCLNL